MKNFMRVVSMTRRFPISFVGSIICSLLVAIMWSGNIGALYPVFQVSLTGKSLQEWAGEQQANAEKTILEIDEEVAQLQAEKQAAEDTNAATDQQLRIDLLQAKRKTQTATIAGAKRTAGYVHFLPNDPFQTILWACGFVLTLTCLRLICLTIHSLLLARMSGLVTMNLQRQFFHHALSMDQKAFGRIGPATMYTHFNTDVAEISTGVRSLFGGALREPLKMLFCFIGAALVSWRLLLITIVFAPIAALIIRSISKMIKRTHAKVFAAGADINRVVLDAFQGLPTVQAYAAEDYEDAQLERSVVENFRRGIKLAFYGSLASPVTELIGMAAVCGTLAAGGYLVLEQQTHLFGIQVSDAPLTTPALLVFFGMLVGMHDPARRLSTIFSSLINATVISNRFYGVLDEPIAITDPVSPTNLPNGCTLEFNDVRFSYDEENQVLRGVNLSVHEGETIAIVGSNGCGKSTLIKMLLRFYDPDAGSISFSGVDLREAKLSDLRGRTSFVTQSPALFENNVINNIRYGDSEASEEEVIAAATQAHAHDFITTQLPDGYETQVGNGGSRLSGGQRQRIALARAIMRSPDLVILDEATSQIDPESEHLIHQTLKTWLKDRTAILITHRFSTLSLADRIVMMDAGRVIATGSHNELLKDCDEYRKLWSQELNKAA